MAFVTFRERNSKGQLCATLTYLQALELQKVINDPSLGTKAQQAYATNVKSLYLGKQHVAGQATSHSERVSEVWSLPKRKDLE